MGFTGSLKRVREEEKGAPMAVRVSDPQPPPDRRPKMTNQDSLRFLATMKRELAGELEKYDEFIAVMLEFRTGRMDTTSLVDYVKVLLNGHPDLIRGFNEFLPRDYIRSHGRAGGSSI